MGQNGCGFSCKFAQVKSTDEHGVILYESDKNSPYEIRDTVGLCWLYVMALYNLELVIEN